MRHMAKLTCGQRDNRRCGEQRRRAVRHVLGQVQAAGVAKVASVSPRLAPEAGGGGGAVGTLAVGAQRSLGGAGW